MDREKTSPIFKDRCTQISETSLCFALSHAVSKKWSVQLSSPSEAKPHYGPPCSPSMAWSGIPVRLWTSCPQSLWCHDLFPCLSAVPGGLQLLPLPTHFLEELPCKEKEKANGDSFGECGEGLEKGWSYNK